MISKNRASRLLCLLLMLALCFGMLAGCDEEQPQETESAPPTREIIVVEVSDEELFDILVDELFVKLMQSDSITMNYFLAQPSVYNVQPIPPNFGDVTSAETIERDRKENRELVERLNEIDPENLRPDQQITYEVLDRLMRLVELMDANDDFSYYIGEIHPTSGIQVQLPVLLAEYNIRAALDFETYIDLLGDTARYFRDLIEYERERSKRGFFMSVANVDEVIANCESFLENREDNLLIVVFEDRVDSFEGLSPETQEELKRLNRELVLEQVLVAYDMLVEAMKELRGKGANEGGLANLPDGEEFATAYMQYKTGSDRTLEEVSALFKEAMDSALATIVSILQSNPVLAERYQNGTLGVIADDTPENYLRMLEKRTAEDFPEMEPVRYVVNEVHESLQEYISPAFYLAPAFDDFYDNVIYINPAKIYDNLSLFTTLAHEGYPGHLYQNVYYLQQSPHFLRELLSNTGYSEGWATYVEMWSYDSAGLDEDEARLMQCSQIYNLLLYARSDLGVNGFGWGENEMAAFLRDAGITDSAVRVELLNSVTADPFAYLPYALGYLEILELKNEAQEALGAAFDLVEFHRFYLEIGAAPFTTIRAYMLDWIESQSAGTLAPAA